ncbi:hypothetical protein WDW86_13035 [Bdellovibrionota bacterium FG-2]
MFSKYHYLGCVFLFILCITPLQLSADNAPPQGDETIMAHITTSYPENYSGQISVQWEPAGFEESAKSRIAKFIFSDNRNTRIVYSPQDLRKGVVLVHTLGKDLLFIRGTSFSAEYGGPMVLTFSKNFFSSDQRQLTFDYVDTSSQEPDTSPHWALQTDDSDGHDPFDSLHIQVYKKVGVPSGVLKIQLIDRGSLIRYYDPKSLPKAPGKRSSKH